jgi:hypothetical protein
MCGLMRELRGGICSNGFTAFLPSKSSYTIDGVAGLLRLCCGHDVASPLPAAAGSGAVHDGG